MGNLLQSRTKQGRNIPAAADQSSPRSLCRTRASAEQRCSTSRQAARRGAGTDGARTGGRNKQQGMRPRWAATTASTTGGRENSRGSVWPNGSATTGGRGWLGAKKFFIFRGTFSFHAIFVMGKLPVCIKFLYIDFTVNSEFLVRVHLKESLALDRTIFNTFETSSCHIPNLSPTNPLLNEYLGE